MKPILIVTILTGIFFQPAFGQSLELKLTGDFLMVQKNGDLRLSYLPADQFKALDWEPGYAYYLDGKSRQFNGMKYDPELDRIQVNADGNVLTLLPGVVNGVSMEIAGTVTRIFLKVPLKEPVFMEALSIGKIQLLMYRKTKKEKMDIYYESDASNIIVQKEDAVIEFDEILYVWSEDGIEKFKNSEKTITSLMNDREDEIKEFMDEEKIRTKNISDLMKVFDYYNNFGTEG